MSGKTRTSLLSLTVILVLILSAIGPTIVYADDGSGTGTPTPEASSGECDPDDIEDGECNSDENDEGSGGGDGGSGEGESGEGEPSEETGEGDSGEGDSSEDSKGGESESGGEGETDEIQSSAEALLSETKDTAPPAESSLLSSVPENTTVTVLNADGEAQPLATQAAADAIAQSDPIWCPAGQPPIPGANGCTPSFTSFTALLNFIAGNATYQGAGTIFVEQGAYLGGESTVDFNAFNLSNISSASLSITGGWNTSTNTVDPASTSNFNNTALIIGSSANPWGGSLTLNNLNFDFTPTSSTTNTTNGITLHTQGGINLSNVDVMNAPNHGADLNAGGDVTINNSNFTRNQGTGAQIRAGGNVAIANSSFSNPDPNSRRQNMGLDITSGGAVSLFQVLANHNRTAGALINAQGRVTIGTAEFNDTKSNPGGVFFGYGLQVITPDAIDLANVIANDNFLWGADLDAGGDVAIADSIFNGNTTDSTGFIDDTGLLVTSGGRVTLTNVQANNNRLIGAVIDAVGDVAVSGSTFTNNTGVTLDAAGIPTFHGYGLQIVTQGTISLNNVNASDNTLFGAHLEAGGDVAILNSMFNNQTSGSATDQTGRGLEVISGNNVFLTNVTTSNNQLFGGSIVATSNAFLHTVTASNNGDDGVEITAACTVVTGGNYSNNGGYGINLTNPALTLNGSPAFGGNALGDINPASTTTCVPAFTAAGGGNAAGAGGSSLAQIISFTSSRGSSANSVFGASLSSILFGLEGKTAGAGAAVFSGKYMFVYSSPAGSSSLDGLQIIALQPASETSVALVGN